MHLHTHIHTHTHTHAHTHTRTHAHTHTRTHTVDCVNTRLLCCGQCGVVLWRVTSACLWLADVKISRVVCSHLRQDARLMYDRLPVALKRSHSGSGQPIPAGRRWLDVHGKQNKQGLETATIRSYDAGIASRYRRQYLQLGQSLQFNLKATLRFKGRNSTVKTCLDKWKYIPLRRQVPSHSRLQ